MRVIDKVTVLALLFASAGFGQGNVQFTDVKGNSYDLFEELGKGKHVFVTFAKAQF